MTRQAVLSLTQNMSQLALAKLCNISQPLISAIVRGNKKLGRRKCAEFGKWYMDYIRDIDSLNSTPASSGPGRGAAGCTRLVYDKNREIPQLKSWFASNQSPSNDQLEEYSKILNEDQSRRDRPIVTAKALRNWWKNERQKLGIRQREMRSK